MELFETIFPVKLRGTQYGDIELQVAECTIIELLEARRSDEKLIKHFTAALRSWNLTRDGEPVPCTPEAVYQLGAQLALSAAVQWLKEQTRPVADRPTGPLVDRAPVDQGTEISAL